MIDVFRKKISSHEAGWRLACSLLDADDCWRDVCMLREYKVPGPVATCEMAFARTAVIRDAIKRCQSEPIAEEMLAAVSEVTTKSFANEDTDITLQHYEGGRLSIVARETINIYEEDVFPLTQLATIFAQRVSAPWFSYFEIADLFERVATEAERAMKSVEIVSSGKPHHHQVTKNDSYTETERLAEIDPVEALVRQAASMNWKKVGELTKDELPGDPFAQAMASIRFERGNEEAVVWHKDATITLVRVHAPPTFQSFKELEDWLAENPDDNDDGEVADEILYLREIEKFIIRAGHFDTLLEAQATDKEFFYACAKYHKAAYSAGESANVVAALTLEALRRYQIDCMNGNSWLARFELDDGSKNNKFEFILQLSEALAQVSRQPTPEILEMMASTYMVPLEHKMIKGISCPKCSDRSLQEIRRGSLNPRKDFDWPYYCPGGDEYHFRCNACHHSFPVTFWFTK